MQVWNVLHVTHWKYRMQKWRKILPSAQHRIRTNCRGVSSQLRQISTIRKNVLNSSISSTCSHNMVNFGPVTAEIGSGVWGTPANFNGFRILPSLLGLLQRRRSPQTNQTLHDVWLSPWLLHYMYIFGGSCPLTEFCPVQNSLTCFTSKSCVLLHWQRYCTAIQQRASAKLCSMVQGMELRNFGRGRHLYSDGRPSHLASAHILVSFSSFMRYCEREFICNLLA